MMTSETNMLKAKLKLAAEHGRRDAVHRLKGGMQVEDQGIVRLESRVLSSLLPCLCRACVRLRLS